MTVDNATTCVKNKETILLVDDDLAFLQVAKAILQSKGFAVNIACNGKEAVAALQASYFNLVILDILLPDMSGLELLTSLNRVQPDIISIISTGYSSVENSVQSLNLGAFAYLEKPLNPERLLEVIRRGLEKQKLLLENRRLLKELEQRNRDLNILLSVSQSVISSINREQIINSALEIVSQSLDIDGSYWLSIKAGNIVLHASRGFDSEADKYLKGFELNDSVVSSVLTNNEPVIFSEAQIERDPLLSYIEGLGYKSFLGVPVWAIKGVEGVMLVSTFTGHNFSPPEVNIFNAIGREIAITITNSQLLEETSTARALRELDTLRKELLANVSHELRTPLAAIKGFASSLLQPDISFDDETRQSFIQTIDSEADRLSRLIDDLLLMSRIEAGAFKITKEWYQVSEIIDAIKDRLYTLTIKHNLRIIVAENLPAILVDGHRIGEVVSNLVENAVKYSPESGEIRIEVTQDVKNIITHVIDNGVGIPLEYQSMVFDRFNQLASKNGQRKGSGLGLCICRGIIESHGGKIWVESNPGKGTRFSFSIPLAN